MSTFLHLEIYPASVLFISFSFRNISEATLAILKGETIPLDVLKIKGEQDQPVFALTSLRWGSYRDAAGTSTKNGPRDIRPPSCSWDPLSALQRNPRKSQYAHLFLLEYTEGLPTTEIPVEEPPEQWEEVQLSAVELTISTQNYPPDLTRSLDSMSICIEPDTISKSEFIRTGIEKIKDPLQCPKDSQKLHASRCNIQLPQGTDGHFSIDSEEYEAMAVEVTLLPRKLRFLCHPSQKEQFTQTAAPA
ncbi:hypothetical protein AB205_0034850 [Aquarana catesbeiana]|uniref:Acylglycerol kinase C-terminal domain-containing protein n=1 Tax=Aquarana catesbeiana TaxID=8400 RepID=A0A2G9PNP0_AQUCT|nr:hypothetical protein AB205_0034850 [Aquarana catesbeiana]